MAIRRTRPPQPLAPHGLPGHLVGFVEAHGRYASSRGPSYSSYQALKRRCLFLHIDFPDAELERRILLSRVPELPERLAEELVRIIGVLRGMALKKSPSVAETIDWGRTLLALGMDTIDDATIAATLGVVLKHQSDQVRAAGELRLN